MAELDRAFLHDILENPDDDAPRLIYADWLDERGNEARAEFIRLQCELVRLDRYDPRWPGLKRREGQLLAGHSLRWIQDAGVEGLDEPRFRRGFIEHAAFTDCLEYLNQASRLFQRVPLSSATFGSLGGWNGEMEQTADLGKFFRSRHVRPLRRLEFHAIDQLPGEDLLASLAHVPPSACLEELDLSDNSLVNEDLEMLARCPTLARLRVLSLADNNYGPAGLRRLMASPHLKNLRELDLGGEALEEVSVEGVAALAASPSLANLTALSLRGHHIGGEGMSRLAAWPGLQRLVCLNLRHNFGLGPAAWRRDRAGLRDLVESPYWNDLRELDVSGGTLGELEALEMFLAAPKIASLRVLTLGDLDLNWRGDIHDEAARLLARAATLDGLIELRFPGPGLSEPRRRLLRDRFAERLVLVE
jgi:uncharacterized protein (TIGR02996 family)